MYFYYKMFWLVIDCDLVMVLLVNDVDGVVIMKGIVIVDDIVFVGKVVCVLKVCEEW